ncbi:MAG: hypothetical protein AB1846_11110 [Chloroflexota bacterium]
MNRSFTLLVVLSLLLLSCGAAGPTQAYQTDDTAAPSEVVKLIFIHHSTGENWLTDGYGNLGKTLGQNNYFVSDTNYGWGPNAIGDRTDIPDWPEWFASAETPTYMQALYTENGKHSTYTRTLPNPGGENRIIMFKSCFPNSDLSGKPDDPPTSEVGYTVGHAKYVYNTILQYFGQHTDKLFVVVTAPPLSDSTHAANARAFNNWLVYNWLWENNYQHGNVVVFDFYNVLTHSTYHHRFYDGEVQHIFGNHNTNYYPSSPGDDHPSVTGSRKATTEFVSLLNVYYQRWKDGARNVAFVANKYQDGWVLESGENSNQGGSLNNTASILYLGDNATNRQYRAILSFNTASLPDNAVIVSASLKVRQKSVLGTDPFKTHGNLVVDIRRGAFSNNPALQLGDFKAASSRVNVASVNKTAVNKWHNAGLLSAGFGHVNRTGITQFRLRFAKDDNNDNGADYRAFYSANSANKPALWITYYPAQP